jgi:hypothetical protein
MSRRRAIGARVRFEVLKRDGFRCVYCGAMGSEAELRVDHVHPVAHGGGNEMANLATACHPCNAGKAALLLGDRDEPVHVLPHRVYLRARASTLIDHWHWKVGPISEIKEPDATLALYETLDAFGWHPTADLLPLIDLVGQTPGTLPLRVSHLRRLIAELVRSRYRECGSGVWFTTTVSTWAEARELVN